MGIMRWKTIIVPYHCCMPALSKICESVALKQLTEYMTRQDETSPVGYTPNAKYDNVSSEGTSLLGWRAIRGLVVSFQLLCTVIRYTTINLLIYLLIYCGIVYPAINSKKNSYYIRICKFEAKRLKIRVDIKLYMSQCFYNNISSIFDRRGSLHQIQVIWQVYCNDVNKLTKALRTKSALFVSIWNRRLSSFS